MASFGFSIGDIIAVSTLAWKTYRACKDAGSEFKEVTQEVLSLSLVLREVEDEASNPASLVRRQQKLEILQVLLGGCEVTLNKVREVTLKFSRLETGMKKVIQRLRFALEDLATTRARIVLHTGAMNTFLTNLHSGALERIERKLEKVLQDMTAGDRSSWSIRANSMLSLTEPATDPQWSEDNWVDFRREMMMEGFARDELDDNRSFVEAWVQDRLSEDLLPSRTTVGSPTPEHLPGDKMASLFSDMPYSRSTINGIEKTDRLQTETMPSRSVEQKQRAVPQMADNETSEEADQSRRYGRVVAELVSRASQQFPLSEIIVHSQLGEWYQLVSDEFFRKWKELPKVRNEDKARLRIELISYFPDISECHPNTCRDNMFSHYSQFVTKNLNAHDLLSEDWSAALLRADATIEELVVLHMNIWNAVDAMELFTNIMKGEADIVMALCRAKIKAKQEEEKEQKRH